MVNEQLADGDWCTTQELFTLVAAGRATAAGQCRPERASSSHGVPSGNPGPVRAPLPAAEVISDSDTDLSDGQLESAIALAVRRAADHGPEGALPDHGLNVHPTTIHTAPEELS